VTDFEVESDKEVGAPPEEREDEPSSLLDLAALPEGEARVAKRVVGWWTEQNKRMRRMEEEWRVNRARRRGMANVKLIKRSLDTADYEVWAPPMLNYTPATFNKADRLCRRVCSFLFTDPPLPEAVPARDDDEARDAAETATRILQALTSDRGVDDVRTARRAFDLASTFDSGFRYHWVDPMGGGTQPVTVQAHPKATTLAQCMPQVVDPATGLPYGGPYETRYVRADGTLTPEEHATGLQRQFLPAIRTDVLYGKNVRLMPASANDIWEADAAMVGSFQRAGDLKGAFPKLAEMPPEEFKQIVGERPDGALRCAETWQQAAIKEQDDGEDDALVWTIVFYRKQGATEMQGVYAVVVGKDTLAHIQPWSNPNSDEPLMIPIDQFKQFDDEDNPYGRGLMRQLGGGNELLAQGFDAVTTHFQRTKNRHIFVPTNSIVQAKQLQSPTQTVIPTNPGGKPEYEDIPPLPQQYFQFIDTVIKELNDESGLQEVAQGVNTPSVQSGLHARQIIEQSIVAVSDLRQNTERALVRGYLIRLQLVKAFFSLPQDLRYLGDDGQYKVDRWTSADLRDVSDVRVGKGSFTQLSPPAKAQEAERMFATRDASGQSLLSLQELKHLILGNVGGLIGIQDDPFRMRVKRQLATWQDGPDAESEIALVQRRMAWEQLKLQSAALPPEQQQAFQQQAMQMLDAQYPLKSPFDRLPVDEEPAVASIRHFEIARTLVSIKSQRYPAEWLQLLLNEYTAMRGAAGISTLEEQRQAQAQQAEAAQKAEAQKAAAKTQGEQVKSQAEVQKAQIETQGRVLEAQAQGRPQVSVNLTGEELMAGAAL
jgi:hypothetical protein